MPQARPQAPSSPCPGPASRTRCLLLPRQVGCRLPHPSNVPRDHHRMDGTVTLSTVELSSFGSRPVSGLARVVGLEPTTSGFGDRRATRCTSPPRVGDAATCRMFGSQARRWAWMFGSQARRSVATQRERRPVRDIGGRRRSGSLDAIARRATDSARPTAPMGRTGWTTIQGRRVGSGRRPRVGPPRRADRATTSRPTTTSDSTPQNPWLHLPAVESTAPRYRLQSISRRELPPIPGCRRIATAFRAPDVQRRQRIVCPL